LLLIHSLAGWQEIFPSFDPTTEKCIPVSVTYFSFGVIN